MISQCATILFTFVTRYYFVSVIGVELLGLNSTFASILATLALAELGIQSAITYNLYKPLHDDDKNAVIEIMNIYRLLYRGIGILLLILSIFILPFLHFFIKDIEIGNLEKIYFLLQASASISTYFFSYKRTLLFADQRDYVCKLIDLIIGIVFNILQCISLVLYKNYALYLILKIIQVYCGNIIVHAYCKRNYSYVIKSKINIERFRILASNIKDVFFSRIAGYIYSATDNLIISSFIGIVSVGYLTNYTTITKSLRALIQMGMSSVTPYVGKMLRKEKSVEIKLTNLKLFHHIRFLIAVFSIIPLAICIDEFIILWLSKDMILHISIMVLIALDLYIDIVHSALIDFINGEGLFRENKYGEIGGAILNICLSIILAQSIGIQGVLIGTVISQLFFWVYRSWLVLLHSHKVSKIIYLRYWCNNVKNFLIFVGGYFLCEIITKKIVMNNDLIELIVKVLLTFVVLFGYVMILFVNNKEQKMIVEYIKK